MSELIIPVGIILLILGLYMTGKIFTLVSITLMLTLAVLFVGYFVISLFVPLMRKGG